MHAAGHARRAQGLEQLERGVERVAHGTHRCRCPRGLNLPSPITALFSSLYTANLAAKRLAHAEHLARHQRPVGNKRAVRLLGHADHLRLGRVLRIQIPQVHVDELHAGHDLELLLHAAAPLDGVLQQPVARLPCPCPCPDRGTAAWPGRTNVLRTAISSRLLKSLFRRKCSSIRCV